MQLAADPAERRARQNALLLYTDIAVHYGNDPQRWASLKSTMLAVGRLALPTSLKQLSGWLARGGLAQGAPSPYDCRVVGPLSE